MQSMKNLIVKVIGDHFLVTKWGFFSIGGSRRKPPLFNQTIFYYMSFSIKLQLGIFYIEII